MVTTVPEFRLGREVRTSTRRTGGTEQRAVEGHRVCKQVCCNVVGEHFLSEKIWSIVQPDVSVRRLCGPLIRCLRYCRILRSSSMHRTTVLFADHLGDEQCATTCNTASAVVNELILRSHFIDMMRTIFTVGHPMCSGIVRCSMLFFTHLMRVGVAQQQWCRHRRLLTQRYHAVDMYDCRHVV